MIVSRLICDGCGIDSGLEDCREWRDDLPPKKWLTRDERHPIEHYCPTCRRAIEAKDLRTALVAPRKGKA